MQQIYAIFCEIRYLWHVKYAKQISMNAKNHNQYYAISQILGKVIKLNSAFCPLLPFLGKNIFFTLLKTLISQKLCILGQQNNIQVIRIELIEFHQFL